MRGLALLWLLAGLPPTPGGSSTSRGTAGGPTVDLLDPFPFSHRDHEEPFAKAGVDCVSCHPVGLRAAPGSGVVPPADLPEPRATCHACHLRQAAGTPLPGAPRRAKPACMGCHASLQGLKPRDHDALWPTGHADTARGLSAGCKDCHAGRWCTDCHVDRGPVTRNPHGIGFRVSHGIEARLDPARCTSCHTGATCTTCHADGVLPW